MPVAFALKTLTSAEPNYANIEHELLGVVFGTPPKTDSLTVSHPPKAPTPSKSVLKLLWNLNPRLQGLPQMSKMLL